MGPAEGAQLGIPGGLHPKGDAVHPRSPEALQALRGNGLGVGFQRDLRPGYRGRCLDEPRSLRRGKQAGGAAAKIDGIRLQGCVRRKAMQLPQQCVHIGIRYAALAGVGIKIAVPTFGKTVRNMQIKPKRHIKSQPFS